ncbi:GH92 family glycosyl hydrolase [Litorihabitans aurantiacus]|uniref:SLH domain-containing protein n=1 Tax=Litorihabitans aurantiacus TaxID=1930061 RepID=A0AA38CSX2_9MICO|nr:GH92 family glycosyl hydrolase [Litorihabitans aurantiacus]GMA32591.1 hypothetical protein GCM10025875_25830 [Litorihabitans aurantiacus]
MTSLSYVDAAGAAANHAAEATSFDTARAAADALWEDRLGDVAIPTDDVELEDVRVFYSALYRSFLAPNTGTDVDRRYRGWDGEIHVADDFTYYQNFSLWDTYRTQQQLLYLLAPEESRDMALSVVRQGEQLGWLPRWGYGPVETNIMTGDPGTAFLVSAWSQGLLAGHEEETYAVLAHNADNTPDPTSVANGRAGNPVYLERGYVTHEPGENGRPGDYDLHHGGSATLEYALSDALLSTMARELGHTEDAARYAARGENYLALFDPTTQSFRARDRSGFFVGSDDPAQAVGFHEGTAVQYEWLVQQDLPGLIELFGGVEATQQRLDDFFVYDELLLDPEGVAREQWVTGTYDYYGQDTYNPNNEPDLHAPYVYQWLGQPHKTADVVAAAMTLFTDGPTGVTGNDDLGTMSAWYVLSAIGAYPIVPGTDVWGLSTPAFESVDVTLDPDWFGTDLLEIRAPGVSAENRYVQQVTTTAADGQAVPVEASHLSGDDLTSAGTLTFEVGPEPSAWATGPDAAPGSLVERGELGTRVAARVAPARSSVEAGGSTTVAVEIIAQADAVVGGTVDVVGSDVVTVDTASREWSIDSGGVPVSDSFPVELAVRDGVVAGTYPITIAVSDGAGVVAEASASVTVAESGWLTAAFDNTGIGDAGAGNADFDGLGYYLLRDALADLGFAQGAAGVVPGTELVFAVPAVEPGGPDNALARGQVLPVPDAYRQARSLSLVGATNNGTPHGGGDVTLTFTDGTTQVAPVQLSDWCTGSPAAGNVVVAKAGQRGNGTGSAQNIGCGLYASAPLVVPEGRTLASITLPQAPNVHVFTVAFDVAAPVLPVVTVSVSPERPLAGATAQITAAVTPGDVAGDLVLQRVSGDGVAEVARGPVSGGGAGFDVVATAEAVAYRVAFEPADPTLAAPATTATDVVVEGRVQAPDEPFVDVPAGSLFFEEISWLFENGYATGWDLGDGAAEYRPVTPIARDAMAAFLYRVAGEPDVVLPATSPFADVAPDNQFYREITWLAQEGISTGWAGGDGTAAFRPLEPIARDAMAAFLYRMADSPAHEAPPVSPFTDMTPATQFYAEVTWLVDEGIATGWIGNDGTAVYQPTAPINRDAMAAFLYRYGQAGFID